jgi:hypothetical protein
MTSRFTKVAAAGLALAVAATALPLSTAEAGHGWGKHHHHHYYHRRDSGASLAAGLFGLTAGLIVGSALSQPRAHYYSGPPPVHYSPQAHYAPAPWSPDWYAYCASKFRSFNPSTGMYLTYQGTYRYCE